jgi:hypothetical protein
MTPHSALRAGRAVLFRGSATIEDIEVCIPVIEAEPRSDIRQDEMRTRASHEIERPMLPRSFATLIDRGSTGLSFSSSEDALPQSGDPMRMVLGYLSFAARLLYSARRPATW